MAYQLSDINRMAARAPEEFLAEADAAFQEKICAAAEPHRPALRPLWVGDDPIGTEN